MGAVPVPVVASWRFALKSDHFVECMALIR